MMKSGKIIFTALVAVCTSGAAMAQDWTGFYAGLNAGNIWAKADAVTNPNTRGGVPVEIHRLKPDGFTGGFTFGYNWQHGHALLGIESDISPFNNSGSRTTTGLVYPYYPPFTPFPYSLTQSAQVGPQATLRFRAGWAGDRVAFYATAGGAAVRIRFRENYSATDPSIGRTTDEAVSRSQTRGGFAWGAGTEIRINKQWSIKGEWLHTHFDNTHFDGGTLSYTSGGTTTSAANYWSHTVKLQGDAARIGVNFRF